MWSFFSFCFLWATFCLKYIKSWILNKRWSNYIRARSRMCVCVCTCVCVYVYACAYATVRVWVRLCARACEAGGVRECLYVCAHACVGDGFVCVCEHYNVTQPKWRQFCVEDGGLLENVFFCDQIYFCRLSVSDRVWLAESMFIL